MNEFRKTYNSGGLGSQKTSLWEAYGGLQRWKGGVWKGDSWYIQVLNVGISKKLGYCFRAFGGFDFQSGDQPARMLDRGWEGEKTKQKNNNTFITSTLISFFPSLTFPTFNLFVTRGWGPGTEAVQVGVPEGVICCSNCLFMFSDEGVYYPEHLLPKFPFSYFPHFKSLFSA